MIRIAFRCVLHRCGSQDIHCQKLCYNSFFFKSNKLKQTKKIKQGSYCSSGFKKKQASFSFPFPTSTPKGIKNLKCQKYPRNYLNSTPKLFTRCVGRPNLIPLPYPAPTPKGDDGGRAGELNPSTHLFLSLQ